MSIFCLEENQIALIWLTMLFLAQGVKFSSFLIVILLIELKFPHFIFLSCSPFQEFRILLNLRSRHLKFSHLFISFPFFQSTFAFLVIIISKTLQEKCTQK